MRVPKGLEDAAKKLKRVQATAGAELSRYEWAFVEEAFVAIGKWAVTTPEITEAIAQIRSGSVRAATIQHLLLLLRDARRSDLAEDLAIPWTPTEI